MDGTNAVHAAAAHGVQGGGGALPHAGAIQTAFGSHDVSSISAHVGGQAAEASKAMGATAYASGNDVAFASQPDLHTAAHEAAHIVQQRSGVSLEGGVGKAGDSYENHADKVADAVVAGKSAEPILNEMSGGAKSAGVQKSEGVQMRANDRTDGVSVQVDNTAGDAAAGSAPTTATDADVNVPSTPWAHPVWPRFEERVKALFSTFNGVGGTNPTAVARSLWLNFFTALQETNATYDATVARKVTLPNGRVVDNLNSAKARELAAKFDPLIKQLQGYASSQLATAQSVAFYSNGCGRKLAEQACDVTLETSIIGVLFDDLKMSGDYDMHLWGALSQAYANSILAHVGNKRIHTFCGPFTNNQNIFSSFERRALKIGAREHKLKLKDLMTNHAVAAKDPGAKNFDPAVATGDFTGTIASYKQPKRAMDKAFEYWDSKFGSGAAASPGTTP